MSRRSAFILVAVLIVTLGGLQGGGFVGGSIGVPVETGSACAVQPNLFADTSGITGFPFASDCIAGFAEQYNLRAPSPTTMPHGIGNNNDGTRESNGVDDWAAEGNAVCIQSAYSPESWQFAGGWWPNFVMAGHNFIVHNEAEFDGDMTFNGSGVNWLNVNGGTITGTVTCGAGASNITYDGECLCGS